MQDQNLSPLKAFFRNKWVLLTIAVDILIIIALITIAVVKSMKKSVLTINVVPVDAVVKVNGQTGYTNGSYRLFPGVYEIEISHPELATKTFSIDLAKHDVGTITTFLSDDDFSFYQLRANLGAFFSLSQIASKNSNQTTDQDTSAESFIATFQKNYQLYSTKLPIEYLERDISTGYVSKNVTIKTNPSCELTLCLEALMFGTDDQNLVRTLLNQQGFNTEDFRIDYQIY
ncbi:hypothetical protein IKF73_02580 [Candidatus Saccharibacteria bacterium]|nr:hypothetical protein [Candidatus Saccharibacteria bacterium]